MQKYDLCECGGTGFIAVADVNGDGIDYVECPKHHAAYADDITGITEAFFGFTPGTLSTH